MSTPSHPSSFSDLQVCAHMLAHPDLYKAWITDDESFSSYVRRMTRDSKSMTFQSSFRR
jgi:hypothetical protein